MARGRGGTGAGAYKAPHSLPNVLVFLDSSHARSITLKISQNKAPLIYPAFLNPKWSELLFACNLMR